VSAVNGSTNCGGYSDGWAPLREKLRAVSRGSIMIGSACGGAGLGEDATVDATALGGVDVLSVERRRFRDALLFEEPF